MYRRHDTGVRHEEPVAACGEPADITAPGASGEDRVTITCSAAPRRTFAIEGTGIRGVTLADLGAALRAHLASHPGTRYEVKAEVKLTPAEERDIRSTLRAVGATLRHFWVPTSEPVEAGSDGPHGPGFVDLGGG